MTTINPNETIDLCDSDAEESSFSPRQIETITVDDDNCSVISDQASRLSLSDVKPYVKKSKSKKSNSNKTPSPKTLSQRMLLNQENNDDIEVIAVHINTAKNNKKSPGKKKSRKSKKLGQLSPATILHGISSPIAGSNCGGGRKSKKSPKRLRKTNQSSNKNNFESWKWINNDSNKQQSYGNVKKNFRYFKQNPFEKQKPPSFQRQEQIRQILSSQEPNFFAGGGKFSRNNNKRKKEAFPVDKDGNPKFRLFPVIPIAPVANKGNSDSSASATLSSISTDQLAKEIQLMTEAVLDDKNPKSINCEDTLVIEDNSTVAKIPRIVTASSGADGDDGVRDNFTVTVPAVASVTTSTVSPAAAAETVISKPPPSSQNKVINSENVGTSNNSEKLNEDSTATSELITEENWSAYGCNLYKSGHVQDRTKGKLRPIVIDASNVAFGHANDAAFSCRGIKVCSDYFIARGHSVVAFLPRYRMSKQESKDPHILEELHKAGIVKFTPSREVEGRRITSYDDRYVVQYAADTGGIIVSNDNYRDLYAEQPLWRDAIKHRILQYTWVSENYIMFPPDPLGPRGPPLDEFLRF